MRGTCVVRELGGSEGCALDRGNSMHKGPEAAELVQGTYRELRGNSVWWGHRWGEEKDEMGEDDRARIIEAITI